MGSILPNTAQGLATFYNAMFESQGYELPPHLFAPCKALMDARIKNLLAIIGPGSGKSLLFSVVYPAFMIGQDPTMTCLGVSAGEALMQGFQKTIMEWVEFNEAWRHFFPNVKPDKVAGWSSERGMFVTGHSHGNPDANYWAGGLTSSALTGKHARIQIGDDLHNKESASSAEACMKVHGDYYRTLIGRADPRGCKFVYVGRRWHQEDVYGHLIKTGDWVVMVLPAERTGPRNELYWDVKIPDGLVCCFNDGTDESIIL